MAGHSKWNNIKRKKEKTDAQKAKIFTKMAREISVVVRQSGADPSTNGKLRDLIAKAKGLNVPNDNINRIIKKAEGSDKDDYEAITYEGYGPGGTAVIVETLTDNLNRTAANVRHAFSKYGASMGQSGSVMFQFSQKGIILIEGDELSEEQVMEDVFEAGADDFEMSEGGCEIQCEPSKLSDVAESLRKKGYEPASAEVEFIASNYVELKEEEDQKRMARLLDLLEEDDDVQNVWHNLSNEEDLDR